MSATAGWVSSISYAQGKSSQLESVSKGFLHLVDRQLCSGCAVLALLPEGCKSPAGSCCSAACWMLRGLIPYACKQEPTAIMQTGLSLVNTRHEF